MDREKNTADKKKKMKRDFLSAIDKYNYALALWKKTKDERKRLHDKNKKILVKKKIALSCPFVMPKRRKNLYQFDLVADPGNKHA